MATLSVAKSGSWQIRFPHSLDSTVGESPATCQVQILLGGNAGRRDLRRAVGVSLVDCLSFSGGRYRAVEVQAAAAGATIGRAYQFPGYCMDP
jgi:hypothetical protein